MLSARVPSNGFLGKRGPLLAVVAEQLPVQVSTPASAAYCTNARSAKWAALGAPRVELCALDAAPGVFSGWTASLSPVSWVRLGCLAWCNYTTSDERPRSEPEVQSTASPEPDFP